MKYIISTMVFLVMSLSAMASTISVHCPQGCPKNPEGSTVIYRHVYTLSNNPTTKFANWVAYEVNPINYGAPTGRAFRSDPDLPSDETLEVSDYKSANSSELEADRGHLAPSAAHYGSHYRHELDYMSNVVPQNQTLNRGVWRELEDAIKYAAQYEHEFYVIAGPVYSKEMPKLPSADEYHIVPSGYYKLVYDDSGGVAFLMEQSIELGTMYCATQIAIVELQKVLPYQLPPMKESALIANRIGCKSAS